MSSDVQQIVQRWKVRPTGPTPATAAATTFSSPAPDLHAEFLRLRADLLRRDPLIANAPSVDDELADALDRLRIVETEYQQTKTELAELQAAYRNANDERTLQRDQIIRLQNDLEESKRALFEMKEREKNAAANVVIGGAVSHSNSGSPPPASSSAGRQLPVPMIRPVNQRTSSPRASASTSQHAPRSTTPVGVPRSTTPKATSRVDSPRRPLGL